MSGLGPSVAGALEAAATLIVWALVHGTLLALITWALCATVLRRARPALVAALWTVVLIKFVIPVGPALPLSWNRLIDTFAALMSGAGGAAASGGASGASTAPVAASAPGWLPFALLIAVAYLTVVLALARRRIAAHRRLRRRSEALPVAGTELAAAIAGLAARVGLRAAPAGRVSDAGAPYVIGLRRPLLVVPRALLAEPRRLEAALLHELAHLRRRDTWVRALQLAVGTLFFFWPVVARVNAQIDRAREMACDQWALARGPLGRRAYARLLVDVARPAARPAAGIAFGIVGPAAELEARVEAVLTARPRPTLGAATGLVLAGWGALLLAGSSAGAAPMLGGECELEDGAFARILTAHPEADADGDGVLTRQEACDHRRRLGLTHEPASTEAANASFPEPGLDLDADGVVSEHELGLERSAAADDLAALVCEPQAGTAACFKD